VNEQLVRAPVLWLSERPWFRAAATRSGIARRFVPGDTVDEALSAARDLGSLGIGTMLDHLGENVTTREGASAATDDYVAAVQALRGAPDVDGAVSVKLTQLGLDLSRNLCLSNLRRVIEAAAGGLVMIDMEGHGYVDGTLEIHAELRGAGASVGVCLQSYLRRTAADVEALPPSSTIRLVKGAYLEPAEVAFTEKSEVDGAYRRLFATLLARGHTVHVATHDEDLVEGARRLVGTRGVDRDRVEYQMLFGIRRDLQERLAQDGDPVRVYVPYGTEWYPYLTRRMAERPANLWFFASTLGRR
jgi:proline dehydrogenase